MSNLNFSNQEQTRIFNSSRGWTGETQLNIDGVNYIITTMKRYTGKIVCSAKVVQVSEYSFSFGMFDKTIDLVSELSKATEKKIKEIHFKGLAILDEKKQNNELQSINEEQKANTPQIGTIIYTYGYGNESETERVIYEIEGRVYKTVYLDGSDFSVDTYVRSINNKFGIGCYFDPSRALVGSDALIDLIDYTTHNIEQERILQEAKNQLHNEDKTAKIEAGKKLLNIPDWASTVIVAELYEDESDSMTDYFWTKSIKTVYLGFSKHNRNNGQELKKFAAVYDLTKELLTNDRADIDQGYNGLPSYFFGTPSKSGWKVSKEKYLDITREEIKNNLYIAAAEGRFILPSKSDEKEDISTPLINQDSILILSHYNDKSIIVHGDTYAHKDFLKSNGGRFNKFLKLDGINVVGWVFEKSKFDILQNYINSITDLDKKIV